LDCEEWDNFEGLFQLVQKSFKIGFFGSPFLHRKTVFLVIPTELSSWFKADKLADS
jgi:hypothetical protein